MAARRGGGAQTPPNPVIVTLFKSVNPDERVDALMSWGMPVLGIDRVKRDLPELEKTDFLAVVTRWYGRDADRRLLDEQKVKSDLIFEDFADDVEARAEQIRERRAQLDEAAQFHRQMTASVPLGPASGAGNAQAFVSALTDARVPLEPNQIQIILSRDFNRIKLMVLHLVRQSFTEPHGDPNRLMVSRLTNDVQRNHFNQQLNVGLNDIDQEARQVEAQNAPARIPRPGPVNAGGNANAAVSPPASPGPVGNWLNRNWRELAIIGFSADEFHEGVSRLVRMVRMVVPGRLLRLPDHIAPANYNGPRFADFGIPQGMLAWVRNAFWVAVMVALAIWFAWAGAYKPEILPLPFILIAAFLVFLVIYIPTQVVPAGRRIMQRQSPVNRAARDMAELAREKRLDLRTRPLTAEERMNAIETIDRSSVFISRGEAEQGVDRFIRMVTDPVTGNQTYNWADATTYPRFA